MNFKNLLLVATLVASSAVCFFLGSYYERASLFFIGNYLAVIVLIAWGTQKIETKHLVAFSLSAMTVGLCVEYTMTRAGLWRYPPGALSLLYPILGWGILMIAITIVAKLIARSLKDVVLENQAIRILPAITSIVAMISLMKLQGYAEVINLEVALVYSIMALASLYQSWNHTTEWNVSIMIAALIIGSYMEFLGSLSKLWAFYFSDIFPLYLAFAWTLNAWTVQAVSTILGIHLEPISYLPIKMKVKDQNSP